MKRLAIAGLSIGLAAVAVPAIYTAGRAAALRECPPVQQGEKLLYSEQTVTGTLCTYAPHWSGYGRSLDKRKAQ